ncbi:MAG TPA: hypothetical protein VL125_00050 [Pelobium sp.]|nr:hypothetical protein [Pelobium sp.]
MKRYLLIPLLFAIHFAASAQDQPLPQSIAELKNSLCHQWLIKKVMHDKKVTVMPAHIKAYMSFYSSHDFSLSGGGPTEYQKWDYIPSLKLIGLFDPKTGGDLGRLKIIKLSAKEMVLYNEQDRDTVYLVRVN